MVARRYRRDGRQTAGKLPMFRERSSLMRFIKFPPTAQAQPNCCCADRAWTISIGVRPEKLYVPISPVGVLFWLFSRLDKILCTKCISAPKPVSRLTDTGSHTPSVGQHSNLK